MSFKKELKKTFSNDDKLLDLRIQSVWYFFLISILLFLLNFFFIAAKFYLDFNLFFFPYIYSIFIVSIVLSLFFVIKWYFRNAIKWYKTYLLWFLFFLVFIILFLPIVISRDWLFKILGINF